VQRPVEAELEEEASVQLFEADFPLVGVVYVVDAIALGPEGCSLGGGEANPNASLRARKSMNSRSQAA